MHTVDENCFLGTNRTFLAVCSVLRHLFAGVYLDWLNKMIHLGRRVYKSRKQATKRRRWKTWRWVAALGIHFSLPRAFLLFG